MFFYAFIFIMSIVTHARISLSCLIKGNLTRISFQNDKIASITVWLIYSSIVIFHCEVNVIREIFCDSACEMFLTTLTLHSMPSTYRLIRAKVKALYVRADILYTRCSIIGKNISCCCDSRSCCVRRTVELPGTQWLVLVLPYLQFQTQVCVCSWSAFSPFVAKRCILQQICLGSE